MDTQTTPFLDHYLDSETTTIARDLKLNLKRVLYEGSLSPEEASLVLLAVATSAGSTALAAHAHDQLKNLGFTPDQVQEASESAALMAMLNTYYRFRHFVQKDDDYRVAGLRMTTLAKPHLGKVRFEMLALAVSVLNGCESCVRSHEQVLRDAGLSAEKIHDLARVASVVKALATLER